MGLEDMKQFTHCPCCKTCKNCTNFQKIIELKNNNLEIYRHTSETENECKTTKDHGVKDIFIIHNKEDVEIAPTEMISEFDQYTNISCPRCQNIMEHARRLLQKLPMIDKNRTLCVCDHCRMKEEFHKSCNECEEIVKKFVAGKSEIKEQIRSRTCIHKIENLMKDLLTNKEKGKQIKSVKSDIYIDKLCRISSRLMHEPDVREFLTETCRPVSVQAEPISDFTRQHMPADKIIKIVDTSIQQSKSFPQKAEDRFEDYIYKYDEQESISISSHVQNEEQYCSKHLTQYKDFLPQKSKEVSGRDANEHLRKKFKLDGTMDKDSELPIDDKIKSTFDQNSSEMSYREPHIRFLENKEKFKSNLIKSQHYVKDIDQQGNLQKELKSDNTTDEGYVLPIKQTMKSVMDQNSSELLYYEPHRGLQKEKEKHKTGIKKSQYYDKSYAQPFLKPEKEEVEKKGDRKIQRYSDIFHTPLSETENYFSYYFPKELKKEALTRIISSSELIKDTQDMLHERAKEEKRKKEELKRKKEGEKRKIGQEEKRRLAEEEEKKCEKEKQQGLLEEKILESKKSEEPLKETISVTERKLKDIGRTGFEKDVKRVKRQNSKESKMKPGTKESKTKLKIDKAPKIDKVPEIDKEPKIDKAPKIDKVPKVNKAPKIDKESLKAEKEAEKAQERERKEQEMREKEERLQKEREAKLKEKEEKERLKNEREEQIKQEKAAKEKEMERERVQKLKEKEGQAKEKEREKEQKEKEKQNQDKFNKMVATEAKMEKAANEKLMASMARQAKEEEEEMKLKKKKEDTEKKARETADKVIKDEGNKTELVAKPRKEPKEAKKVETNKPETKKPEKNNIISESEAELKEVDMKKIKVKNQSDDDLILKLVKLKQFGVGAKFKDKVLTVTDISPSSIQIHKGHKMKSSSCAICADSELELDIESFEVQKDKEKHVAEIIIGQKILKYKPPFVEKSIEEENIVAPILFKSAFIDDDSQILKSKEKEEGTPLQIEQQPLLTLLPAKATKIVEQESAGKGYIRYTLSDRTFIDKGWTMLPTEKVMNIYRMRPAHPEFDWFAHNKNKRLMQYNTGEKLAEFDDNGRGRWFYRNGRLALDFYDAEEINAQQRFVIYSSGEPDERGRSHPITILASFDYLGNGIVFDHNGKIRLKYNQTEGVLLDRSIGPVSHWKWHTLNDPPVLQQVMIDTQMSHKDPDITKLGTPADDKTRPDNEEMLAIEFDNFIKEKSKKLTQKFKPFQIKLKALKINEQFSLRVLDQATVYLLFRDGSTNLKLNIGMILDHKEIVDTETAEVGEVLNNFEKLPARSESLAVLQRSVSHAQRVERARIEREHRVRRTSMQSKSCSADKLTAAASRPLRPSIWTVPSSSTGAAGDCLCICRKPSSSHLYYDTRLI